MDEYKNILDNILDKYGNYSDRHPFKSINILVILSTIFLWTLVCLLSWSFYFNINFFFFTIPFLYFILGPTFFQDYSKSETDRLNFNLGLRKIYKKKRRLPKFICKHCSGTIIVKNLNIICPFCKAEFLMTDDVNKFQMGDVLVKNFRNIVDESTMERVLFDCCPVCEGKIQYIDCYHDDCKKEINIFEDYDEKKLELERYNF